ncbi:MAG: SoxR reducing system RseC family protein [Firmicutes bacterium]|nr:SoxR reducing system RseC family protein [Bacillota bacterium]
MGRVLPVERIGTVKEIKGENAIVHLRRHLSCENCGRCGGILGAEDRRDHYVEVSNPLMAQKGQNVLIEIDDRRALFIAFLLYLVPLGGLVAGILLGFKLSGILGWGNYRELFAAAVGFVLMALIFGGISLWDRRVKRGGRFRPVITALLEEGDLQDRAD